MSLKTNYKNDMFSGKRKYQVTENSDGTISLDDVTEYVQNGDVFSADDINKTNTAVNNLDGNLQVFSSETNQAISEIKSVKTIFIQSGEWSSSVPYIQTVSVKGITANDTPIGDLYLGDNPNAETVKSRKKAWSCVDRFTTGDNSITLYCYEEKPSTSFTMQIKGE